jgi:putative oxidoreductase
LGRFLLRLLVGGFFIGHGTQKLFGWFGGRGLDATSETFESIGLHPGRRNAVAAGVAETGGGALILAGAETPLAASVLTSSMLTAIQRVHGKNGPWNTNGGFEYNAVLIAALVSLAEVGPGRLSVDHALGRVRAGGRWAIATLALGAVGAAAAHALSASSEASQPTDVAPSPSTPEPSAADSEPPGEESDAQDASAPPTPADGSRPHAARP